MTKIVFLREGSSGLFRNFLHEKIASKFRSVFVITFYKQNEKGRKILQTFAFYNSKKNGWPPDIQHEAVIAKQ